MRAKRLAPGAPVRFEGQTGTVTGINAKGEALVAVGLLLVRALATEFQWAPEGFWYLPHRVGTPRTDPAEQRTLQSHPDYPTGRDDLLAASLFSAGA